MAEAGPQQARKLLIKIVSPFGLLFKEEADSVLLPAKQGDMLVLYGRAPLFVALNAGRVVIDQNNEKRVFLIARGMCEIRRNICSIMAWAVDENYIDHTRIQAALDESEQALPKAISQLSKNALLGRIAFLKMLMDDVNK